MNNNPKKYIINLECGLETTQEANIGNAIFRCLMQQQHQAIVKEIVQRA